MSAAREDLGGAVAAPPLTMWQMAALTALAQAAPVTGDWVSKPANVQTGTLAKLGRLGLVETKGTKASALPWVRRQRLLCRVTEAGRAALASPNPAAAVPAPRRRRRRA